MGGQYYFICPPGSSATLYCTKGLNLSWGSFLFENVRFTIPRHEKGPLLAGKRHAETEVTTDNERTRTALIAVHDVRSLFINHCVFEDAIYSGIVINCTACSPEQVSVSVRSSKVLNCMGTGLWLQGDAPFSHISIHDNFLVGNLFGVVIDSPSHFYLDKNEICSSVLSGVVVIRATEGRLLRNELILSGKHGILFNKTNAFMENNTIYKNSGWVIVCCCESNLHCENNWIENNLCGGFRIIFNGKGNVLIQKCDFVENVGPAVYPAAANELCGTERKCFAQVSAAPAHCKVPVPLFLRFIVEDTSLNCESVMEFKSPVLRDNRLSDVSETMFDVKRNLCSACCKKLDNDLIECPRCHIARYCNKECFDRRKSVHYSICGSILEAYKGEMRNCLCIDSTRPTNTSTTTSRR